jgi:hypothetical protein
MCMRRDTHLELNTEIFRSTAAKHRWQATLKATIASHSVHLFFPFLSLVLFISCAIGI